MGKYSWQLVLYLVVMFCTDCIVKDEKYMIDCMKKGEKGQSRVKNPGLCFECWERGGRCYNCYCSKE